MPSQSDQTLEILLQRGRELIVRMCDRAVLLTSGQVQARLNITAAQLRTLRRNDDIVHFLHPVKRKYLYPEVQFQSDTIAPWAPQLAKLHPRAGAFAFLATRLKSLGGETYIDRLQRNPDDIVPQMMERAEAFGDQNL